MEYKNYLELDDFSFRFRQFCFFLMSKNIWQMPYLSSTKSGYGFPESFQNIKSRKKNILIMKKYWKNIEENVRIKPLSCFRNGFLRCGISQEIILRV